LKLDQRPPVSQKAWKALGSRMFVDPGKPASVEELLKGMIVQSGNDASVVLAETLAGSEEAFAQQMNREAQRMGLKNTQFGQRSWVEGFFSLMRCQHLLAADVIKYPGLCRNRGPDCGNRCGRRRGLCGTERLCACGLGFKRFGCLSSQLGLAQQTEQKKARKQAD
ncbi:MAG: D-alanyl-D-alanine carboxypeptidase, partial [Betaproteobacteria bacterium]|nr:D-alanyl-D-alanine carboxypeptidase [Betaproteobacteria bacterium]